jgi:hypothetical protein
MKKRKKLIPMDGRVLSDSVLIFGITVIVTVIGFVWLIYLFCQS